MKRQVYKILTRLWRFVVANVKGAIIGSAFTALLVWLYSFFLAAQVNNILGWLATYLRLMLEGFRSGVVSGTLFKNAHGTWSISWQIGFGQPFAYVLVGDISEIICFLGGLSLTVYFVLKYRSLRRLRKVATYLRHPHSFWNTVSVRTVVALAVFTTAVGFIAVYPNFVVPRNIVKLPSGPASSNIIFSGSVSIQITHDIIIRFDPSVLEKSNLTGRICCIVADPENASWRVEDVNTSTIVLSGTIIPCCCSVNSADNSTAVLLVWFEKSQLAYLFNDASISTNETVSLSLTGKLNNGEDLAGTSELNLEQ